MPSPRWHRMIPVTFVQMVLPTVFLAETFSSGRMIGRPRVLLITFSLPLVLCQTYLNDEQSDYLNKSKKKKKKTVYNTILNSDVELDITAFIEIAIYIGNQWRIQRYGRGCQELNPRRFFFFLKNVQTKRQ